MCPECAKPIADCICKKAGLVPPAGDGIVRIRLETKGRGGKSVTTVKGAPGDLTSLEAVTKELKRRCGTGGTLKNFVIEIQGDHRDVIANYFEGKGATVRKS
jgi:translation initiation factor 1